MSECLKSYNILQVQQWRLKAKLMISTGLAKAEILSGGRGRESLTRTHMSMHTDARACAESIEHDRYLQDPATYLLTAATIGILAKVWCFNILIISRCQKALRAAMAAMTNKQLRTEQLRAPGECVLLSCFCIYIYIYVCVYICTASDS